MSEPVGREAVIFLSPKMAVHSLNWKLLVTIKLSRSYQPEKVEIRVQTPLSRKGT